MKSIIPGTLTAFLILFYLGCVASSAHWRDSAPPDSAVVAVAAALTGMGYLGYDWGLNENE